MRRKALQHTSRPTTLENEANPCYRKPGRMRDMKNHFLVIICVSLALLAFGTFSAKAQKAVPAEGAQQFAELGDLKLQGGTVIQDFRLGYRTMGKLNAQKSNAILWPTWLGGKSQDLLQFLGPGKV